MFLYSHHIYKVPHSSLCTAEWHILGQLDKRWALFFLQLLASLVSICFAELANCIENTIAIAFLSTIAIDKGIFQLLPLLLLLIRTIDISIDTIVSECCH